MLISILLYHEFASGAKPLPPIPIYETEDGKRLLLQIEKLEKYFIGVILGFVVWLAKTLITWWLKRKEKQDDKTSDKLDYLVEFAQKMEVKFDGLEKTVATKLGESEVQKVVRDEIKYLKGFASSGSS